MVRAFVAVDLSGEARSALAGLIEGLQLHGATGVRWVKPEGIHLTLKFLGEIAPELVDTAMAAMEGAAQGTGPFILCLTELGAFPNASAPRVIWVGLGGGLGPLGELQQRVGEQMFLAGNLPRERRAFTPHLTLGRLTEKAGGEERLLVSRAIGEVSFQREVSWRVNEVHLMRSILTPSGALYHRLGSAPL